MTGMISRKEDEFSPSARCKPGSLGGGGYLITVDRFPDMTTCHPAMRSETLRPHSTLRYYPEEGIGRLPGVSR